jgi:nitroimidazol reductase NimA-like FMN-containing flavoprotein (pyridoxamine 5'-phosphate oxidase superfamily)
VGNDCYNALVLVSMRISNNFKTFMQRAQVMRVATLGKGGFPHVVPVCPVFHANKIYFVTDAGTAKFTNMQRHPKVAAVFDQYDPSWRRLKGILIQGTPKFIRSGAAFFDLRARFYRKFPPYKKKAPFDVGESVIVEITPKKSFSWQE